MNFDWWEDEFQDFIELCSYLNIAVEKDKIKFRGFYAGGDRSGFSAQVDISKLAHAIKNQAWKDYTPMQVFDFTAPGIDRRVMALVAQNILPNEPQIFSHSRLYGGITDLGISEVIQDGKRHNNIFEELNKLETWLKGVAEILNRYLFDTLEKQ